MVVRFYGLVHWEDPMDEALGTTTNSCTSTENAVTKDGILHYKAGTSYLGKEQWKTCFVVLRWALGLRVGTEAHQRRCWDQFAAQELLGRWGGPILSPGRIKPPVVAARQQKCNARVEGRAGVALGPKQRAFVPLLELS